jgi:hypothetical protein
MNKDAIDAHIRLLRKEIRRMENLRSITQAMHRRIVYFKLEVQRLEKA